MSNTTAKRYVITASLITTSPLAIHTGLGSNDLTALGLKPEGWKFRPQGMFNVEDLESCDQLIARDWQSKPYLPGSSLKGVLNAYVQRLVHPKADSNVEQTLVEWAFGKGTASESAETQGCGGAIVFEDAFLDESEHLVRLQPEDRRSYYRDWIKAIQVGSPLKKFTRDLCTTGFTVATTEADAKLFNQWNHLPYWSPADLTYVETMIAVDRRTGAVSNHKLFTSEAVPAGIPFVVRFVIDHGPRALEATKLLLRTLAGFNLAPVDVPIQLGAGTNHGWGQMRCEPSSLQVQTWTKHGFADVDVAELNVLGEFERGRDQSPPPLKPRVQIDLTLHMKGPFLVNDPSRVCAIVANKEKILVHEEDETKIPDHLPRVASVRIEKPEDGANARVDQRKGKVLVKPLLPATSFKGSVRSQLERILRTIDRRLPVSPHGELLAVDENAPRFVRELLGYASQESGLWCTEFIDSHEQDLVSNLREMVAIDRFTGGASNHAKFQFYPLHNAQPVGVLCVDLPNDENEGKKTLGAIALLLRDLVEGDIAFGMGDTKSFGHGTATIQAIRYRDSATGTLPKLSNESKQSSRLLADLTTRLADSSQIRSVLTDTELKSAANQIINDWLAAVRQPFASKTPATGVA